MNKNDKQFPADEVCSLVEPLAEIGLDTFINNQILKDIPFLGTIAGIFKAGKSLSDYLLLRKLKVFIDNIQNIPDVERANFNKKMEGKKERTQISKLLFHHINHHDDEDKSRLLGYVFSQYIKGDFSEEVFKRIASLISSINLDILKHFVEQDGKFNWLDAHDYIAHGLAMFEVPQTNTVDDIGPTENTDQTGMYYGVNPWGAEVINILRPYYEPSKD